MNLFSFLWQPNTDQECHIDSIDFVEDKLEIGLTETNPSTQNELQKNIVFLKRHSSEELQFTLTVKSQDESRILYASIDISKYKDQLADGIWDGYFEIKSRSSRKRLRIKYELTDRVPPFPYYLEEQNKSLECYSTIQGNFSMKSANSKSQLFVETVNLTTTGKLKIQGHIIIPKWEIEETKPVQMSLLMHNPNGVETEFPIDKRTHYATLDCYNLYRSEFQIEMDLNRYHDEIQTEVSLLLFIKMEQKNQTVTLPVTVPSSLLFNSNAVIPTSNGAHTIILGTARESQLQLTVFEEPIQLNIESVYVKENTLSINGSIYSSHHELDRTGIKEAKLLFLNRNTNEEWINNCRIEGNSFTYSQDLAELIGHDVLSLGIWDLYVIIENQRCRLVSRLDGIRNKQKVIKFPQILLRTSTGQGVVVKPYYTVHEELSLFIRNYVTVKSIQKVQLKANTLTIQGKLNVQQPNEDFPFSINGEICIKVEYGEKYILPVKWTTVKTNKSAIEFDFIAEIDIQSVQSPMKILKNINFDLITCNMHLNEITAIFNMNIDPSKVIVDLEDRLRQRASLNKVMNRLGPMFYRIFNKVIPTENKMVIFQSFHGKSYSCSPKAIYEELLANNYKVKPVWVLDNALLDLPGNPKIVKPNSLKYFYYMARSKYFVNNGNFPDFYHKRSNAVHLQTWHGTPLKKLGFDIDADSPSFKENTSPELIKRNKRWDYLIGPNQYTSEILKRAFKFEKTMLDVGYPRNDLLYREDIHSISEQVKGKLGLRSEKKIILYAPTWRDYEFHNGKSAEPFEFKFNLKTFQERFGEKYILLVRLHYRDAARLNLDGFEETVYNVSNYDDIQELYLISDLLITDYSSVMYDFANLGRPMIFFAYDYSRYGSKERGFYIDFKEEAPGPIVSNQEELFDEIQRTESIEKRYLEKYLKFKEKYCHLEDGSASKRTINHVFSDIERKKFG